MIEYMDDFSKFWQKIGVLIKSKSGFQNLIICMEECAELSQTISKFVRHCNDALDDVPYNLLNDVDNIIEEMADVLICIAMLQKMLFIPDEDLDFMIRKKMKRNIQRLKGKI